MERVGIYPGTFDPITKGHLDIIRRSLKLVDHLVVGIGVHANKSPMLTLEDRIHLIESEAAPLAKETGARVSVTSFTGLVVNVADAVGACMIIRGLRGGVDYEYEAQMVGMNGTMNPRVETVFLSASPATQFITGTLVRQIAGMGGDISAFVPPAVAEKIVAQLAKKS